MCPSFQIMGLNLYNMLSSTLLGYIEGFFFFPIVVLEMCYNLVFLSSNVTWYNCFVPRMSDLIQRRQLSPWLWPDFLYIFFKQGREHKRSLNILHNFTDTV